MTDRRPLEAAIHRQLAIVWSAGITAGAQPVARDLPGLFARQAARQRVIDDAAREILRAIEKKGGNGGR